jgi:hypothetical protein
MEFLIRRIDGEWFDFHKNQMGEILRPASSQTRIITGQGDHRIEVEGAEISFSIEDVGIQITFEKASIKPERAEQIVQEILQNIENKTKQKGKIVFFG